MTCDKNYDKCDHADHIIRKHASHLVNNRCDYSGCKSERQQTRVRQHVAEPAAHIVKIICAKCQTKRRVFLLSSRHKHDSHRSCYRQCLRSCIEPCRKYNIHLCDRCKNIARQKHQYKTDQKHKPKNNVTEEVHHFSVFQTEISFDPQSHKQVDDTE